MTRLVAVTLASLGLMAGGCENKPASTSSPEKPASAAAPMPSASAPSVAAAGSATAASAPASAAGGASFAMDPGGKVTIDMPAPKEHIKATAKNVAGELTMDTANLTSTKGIVKVDLSTLTTATFGDAKKDASQTEHALNWLEVGPKASPEDQAKNKFIVFTIKSVEGLSATDLSKITATKDGPDEVRSVNAKVKGEVLLHGKTSQREAEVTVSFRGPANKPTRVDVKTSKPLKIVLADHDVKPRDNFGKIAQGAFDLLGTKVAHEANISLDLTAKPR